MLTVHDVNTQLEKYSSAGFWYEIDFNKLELGSNKQYTYDFCNLSLSNQSGNQLIINNSLWNGQYYFKDSSGNILDCTIWGRSGNTLYLNLKGHTDVIMCLFISNASNDSSYTYFNNYMFIPRTDLVVPVVNGEFEEKFYDMSIL